MHKTLDTKKITQLHLSRHGWFTPEYELTDSAESYGKLSYNFKTRRTASVVTASGSWTFEFEKFFSLTIHIVDENGMIIGKATRNFFSWKRILTMETGFQAEFYPQNLFWPLTYAWNSVGYGKIMRIKSNPFTFKYTIIIEHGMTLTTLMPLLIFLGAHLNILRRAGHQ